MMTQKVKEKAAELGYLACGIIPADAIRGYSERLGGRIEKFPESERFYNHFFKMGAPPESAKSIIVCTQRFNKYTIPEWLKEHYGKTYLFDGRVAYSSENRAKLEFEAYLGMLGISIVEGWAADRWAAAKADIGKFGCNNFIYDDEHGSNIWIESWYVDTELEYDTLPEVKHMPQCGDECHRCVRACPTNALSGSFSMDMGKCIARLIFDENLPDEDTLSQMGEWLYGCDVCQIVCPRNADAFKESEKFPLMCEFEVLLKPESILDMNDDTYRKILNPRFWYAGEDGLWMWKRNALRAMVNSGDVKYHHLIENSLSHEDPRIREVAIWGCRMLGIEHDAPIHAVGFSAKHYRADFSWYTESSFPQTAKIASVQELADYYESNRETYQFSVGYYSEANMADSVFSSDSIYNKGFFEKKFLLLVILEEGSGSTRHRVDSVSPEKGSLIVNITRIIPEIGTADMAQWHTVLELDRSLIDLDAEVILRNESLQEY